MSSLKASTENKIRFVPHYKTMTGCGNSHFSRASDALAEFIDNSIQATKNAGLQRKVAVSVFLDSELERGHIAILDNGKGMSVRELEQFATYSLDTESRPDWSSTGADSGSDSTRISKFGVGAKQAGFFLGYKMRVITCQTNTSYVHELVLDEGELAERYVNNAEVFETEVISRPRHCDEQSYLTDSEEVKDKDILKLLRQHEAQYNSFTVIVLSLRTEMVQRLLLNNRFSEIPLELAEIYFFHLHPQNTPAHYEFGVTDTCEERRFSAPDSGLNPLSIKLQLVIDEAEVKGFDLLRYEGLSAQYFSRSVSAMRFQVSLPDPHDTQREGNSPNSAYCSMDGLLLYYPSVAGNETKPTAASVLASQKSSGGGDMDLPLSLTQAALAEANIEVGPTKSSKSGDSPFLQLFNVYWQNRLVPDAKVFTMSFLPNEVKHALSCRNHGIAAQWKNRVKGFLFLKSDFSHISNNKLQIQVDPSFHEWLNTKKLFSNRPTVPKSLHDECKLWLKSCHSGFDEDFILEDRCMERDSDAAGAFSEFPHIQDKKSYQAHPLPVPYSAFNSASTGRIKLNVGQTVKLSITCGKSGAKPITIYALIERFVTEKNSVSKSQSSFYGDALILYQRVPVLIFNDIVKYAPLQAIDWNNVTVDESELSDILKSSAKSVVYEFCARGSGFRWSHGHKGKDDKKEAKNSFNFTEGDEFDVYMQILDWRSRPIIHRPQDMTRYQIQVWMDDSVVAECCEVYEVNMSTNEFRAAKIGGNNKKFDSYFFILQNLKLRNMFGAHQMVLHVIDGERGHSVADVKIQLEINSLPIVSFDVRMPASLDSSGLNNITQSTPYLPPFSIDILADLADPGHKASPNDGHEIEIIISPDNPDFYVVHGEGLSNKFLFKPFPGFDGSIRFDEESWMLKSCSTPMLLSFNEVTVKNVTFEVSASICPNVKKSFSVSFAAGYPVDMYIADPVGKTLEVECDSIIESLHFTLHDAHENRSGPGVQMNWTIRPIAGPLSCEPGIVNCNGEVTLRNVKVAGFKHFRNKTEVEQRFEFLDTENTASGVIQYAMTVKIATPAIPTLVQLIHNGEVIRDTIRVLAGSTLSDITARLMVSESEEVVWSSETCTCMNVNISASWAPPRSKLKCLCLPDLKVPREVKAGTIEHTVTITCTRFSPLSASFVLLISPGLPTLWKIEMIDKKKDSIYLHYDDDLCKFVTGIYAVDEYGNLTCSDKDLEPSLYACYMDLSEDDIKKLGSDIVPSTALPLRLKEHEPDSPTSDMSTKAQVYEIASSSRFNRPHDKSCPLWLYALDKTHVLSRDSTKLTIMRGRPTRVQISSDNFSIEDPRSEHSISASSWFSIYDLKIHIMDKANQIASLHEISAITVKVVANNGRQVLSSKHQVTKEIKLSFRLADPTIVDGERISYAIKVSLVVKGEHESVELEPAVLNCELIRHNFVRLLSLSYCVNHDEHFILLINEDEWSKTPIVTDFGSDLINLPYLFLRAVTEDGLSYVPSEAFLSISLKYRKPGSKECNSLEPSEYYKSNPERARYKVSSADDDHILGDCLRWDPVFNPSLNIGLYEINVTYLENRDSLSVLPDNLKTVSVSFQLEIKAGAMKGLRLRARSAEQLSHLTVSNGAIADSERRIGDNVELFAVDSKGNQALIPSSTRIFCTLRPEPDSMSLEELPRLADSDLDGVLEGKLAGEAGFLFDNIWLESGSGEGEGQVDLVFYYSSAPAAGSPELICPFHFTSDDERLRKSREIGLELRSLQHTLKAYEDEVGVTKSKLETVYSNMKVVISQLSSSLKHLTKEVCSLTRMEVNDIEAGRMRNISDMEDVMSQVRPPKVKQCNARVMDSIMSIGLVCELGYVDDEATSRVLSWAAQHRMDALVVEDSAAATKLAYKMKVWPLDRINPFTVSGRGRSSEEMKSKLLPLPPFIGDSGRRIPGDPRYLVNVIQLNEEHEHFRDSIFHNIFERDVLFDTLKNAESYLDFLFNKKMSPPSIYTLDGCRLGSEGFLDPRSIPESLDFEFGQQSPVKTSEYADVKKDLQIVNLIPLIEKRDEFLNDLSLLHGLEDDMSTKREKIKELQVELQRLGMGMSAKRVSSGADDSRGTSHKVVKRRRKY